MLLEVKYAYNQSLKFVLRTGPSLRAGTLSLSLSANIKGE